jgi:hypothetical protein
MTDGEQKRILDLVAEGKLSVDDAERLLTALSAGRAPSVEASAPPLTPRPSPSPAPEARGGGGGKGRVAGFSASDIANLALIGVTPEYIQRMRETGLPGLTAGQLQGMAPLGVTPEYVREMQALGVTDLSAGTVQGMFAVGVTGKFVRKWRDAGFESLSADELTDLCVSGASPDYAAKMRRALDGERIEEPTPHTLAPDAMSDARTEAEPETTPAAS